MSAEITFPSCPNCHSVNYGRLVLKCPHCGQIICEDCQKWIVATTYCPRCNALIDFFSQRILGYIDAAPHRRRSFLANFRQEC